MRSIIVLISDERVPVTESYEQVVSRLESSDMKFEYFTMSAYDPTQVAIRVEHVSAVIQGCA